MATFTFSEGSLQLNEEQAKIVRAPMHQNLRILASAGSGKTTTLTGRIAWLLQQGAKPNEIILLTFTHNAAAEMQHRLESLIGNRRILCGTFHALSSQILHEFNHESLQDLYHVDELPLKALDFFTTPAGKTFISGIKWIFIDEYQDINDTQNDFINALHSKKTAITIVGDDAQNIYSWRGSCVDYILNFHKGIADVSDFQLSVNYRSTPAIVAVANSIMRFIPTLPHKELMTSASSTYGDRPEVMYFSRISEERDWVVEHALKATGSTVILSKFNSVLYAYEAAFLKLGACVRFDCTGPSKQKTIYLSTFHGSKGLEWDNVFLVRMNDDVFPQQKDEDGILQERRLFYVATTRARKTLTFTYSRNERALSRFIREIHRPLLVFRNLPRYDLSTLAFQHSPVSVSDWVSYLTGEDFRTIKQIRLLPSTLMSAVPEKSDTIYITPYWWTEQGMATEFYDFARAFWHREMALLRPDSGGQWDKDAYNTIWTIKIAAEDAALFEANRLLFERLADHFFGATEPGSAPAQIQYVDVLAVIGNEHSFDQTQLIRIIQIIHKMRTTLYNLRFANITLSELRFASGKRHSPPQESRCQLIEAWRTYTSRSEADLNSIYLIGICRAIATGRSGVLTAKPGAVQWAKCRDFLADLKTRIRALHDSSPPRSILCRVQTEIREGVIASADMIVAGTVWFFVAGDQPTELQRLDRMITALLSVAALRIAGHTIHHVCLFQIITGYRLKWSVEGWNSADILVSFVEARAMHSAI
jgi:hypothetical protein